VRWLLLYDYATDYLARREPLRPAHLALLEEARGRGELLMAGAVGDPPDRAVLVFTGDDPGPAEAFVAVDPYVAQGLVARWEVQPWTVVVEP
jgi:uncharacterized protein YciI